MKKFIFFTLLLCLFTSVAFAQSFEDYTLQQVSQCDDVQVTIVSATQANTAVTFANDTKAVYAINLGATNEAFVDLDDSVATAGTSDEVQLNAGQSIAINGLKTRGIGVICSTGETTTVQVVACR